jgi:two-component system, NarL family, sensor histidine kinase UhpB
VFPRWIRRPERETALRRRRTAESLLDLGRVISRSLDPEEVAQQIGDSVWRLLGSESAAVYRLEEETGDLIALAVSGPRTPVVRGSRVPRGMGTIGRAVRDRGPIMSVDLLADPAVVLSPELRESAEQRNTHRAVLAVPLVANERVVGALAVGQRQGWRFDDEQVRVAQLFADQAALARTSKRARGSTTPRPCWR